jgi:long-chain acyl-CoA synthetase
MGVDFGACDSLAAMFYSQAAEQGDRPFLWGKLEGAWRPTTWREAAATVTALAAGLTALGLARGDRVALLSENRPEWGLADLAIMAAGAISVPVYTTNTVADHLHILNNSGAKLAIASTRALAERMLAAAAEADHVPAIVTIEPLRLAQSPGVPLHSWDEVIARGRGHEADVARRVAELGRDDTCCLIYTSGTGGAPKGVMLSHGAILHNCLGARRLLEEMGLGDEVFLSFLPLSHAYEHTLGLFFPISQGAQIYYCEGLDQMASNMMEVRPTIMIAVPRLYDVMRTRILKGLSRAGGVGQHLFGRALTLGKRRIETGRLGPLAALENRALDRLVRDKVRQRFGGRLKALVSGGAPLSVEVGLFFSALGLRILQGYGQTEAAPLVSCNPPRRPRVETVGPPVEGVEVRIADDGEICVRGPLLMQGYWRNPEATAEVLRDGWLYTGDIGEIDPDGYIRITDRKKDIIVNSGGDNLSPQRVESFLTLQPEISQAMVHGDRRPHLVALIVPAREWAEAWARAHGDSDHVLSGDLATDPNFRHAIGEAVDRVNRRLSAIEKIRRFTVTTVPFTVDNGMLTPTLKIRRHKIRETFGAMLEALYDDRR